MLDGFILKQISEAFMSRVRELAAAAFDQDFEALYGEATNAKTAFMSASGLAGLTKGREVAPFFDALTIPLVCLREYIKADKDPPFDGRPDVEGIKDAMVKVGDYYLEGAVERLSVAVFRTAEARLTTENGNQGDPGAVEPVPFLPETFLTHPLWRFFMEEEKLARADDRKAREEAGVILIRLFHPQRCPTCGGPVEGYSLKAQTKSYNRWRCKSAECPKSGAIQATEGFLLTDPYVAEEEAEEAVLEPSTVEP